MTLIKRRILFSFPSGFVDMELVRKIRCNISADMDSEGIQEEWVVSANWEPQITGDERLCLSVYLSVCPSDMAWLLIGLA